MAIKTFSTELCKNLMKLQQISDDEIQHWIRYLYNLFFRISKLLRGSAKYLLLMKICFFLVHLTASFFESGPMLTPTKVQNPTILGSGDLVSTQWSHPCRFCHWFPSFGNNGYPPFKGTTQYQTLFLRNERIFSCQPRLKKHLLQLGIHGNPAKRDLCKI